MIRAVRASLKPIPSTRTEPVIAPVMIIGKPIHTIVTENMLRRAAAGEGTDCASLVEAQGGRIRAVAGDPRLAKVTSREDLELVASWL